MKSFIRTLLGSVALAGMVVSGAIAADIDTIAIVAPEQGTDFGWNQQGVEGVRKAAEAAGIKAIIAEGLGYGNIRPTIRELAEDGADLIIAHAAGFTTDAIDVAREMNVHVAVGFPSGPPLVGNYELMAEQAAYLAGYLAARTTKTNVLGIVVSAESPNWNPQSAAFAQGARSVNPNVVLRYAIIGPAAYADVAGARRVTESVISSGADIIFGQGNGSTFGMLQAVETIKPASGDKVWFIDVIGDKTPIDKGHLLSSVIWDMAPIFGRMIEDVRNDTFGQQENYQLSLEDGSQALLRTAHVGDDVWAEIEDVRQKIIAGEIAVDVVLDPGGVRAVMSDAIDAGN
ncbi:putative B6 ABC transporter substrate-binding protein [Devosia sp. A369]